MDNNNTSAYGVWRLIRGIWKIISSFKKYIYILFLCIMIELIYTIIFPLGLQLIIDKAIKNNDLDLLIYVAGGLGIVFVINTIMVICECYVVSLLNAKALDVVRSQMIYQMYSFPVSYYQKNQSTSILAYFSNDISAIENVIIRTLVKVLFFSASIICCTIILFFVEWRLALSVLCLTPLLIIIPDKISNKATDVSYTYKSTEAELLNNIQEHIFGQKIIRLFGLRNHMMNIYTEINQKVVYSSIKSNYLSLLIGATSFMGTSLLLLTIILFGAFLAIKGYITVGTLIAFSAYMFSIAEASGGLSNLIPILYQSTGSMQRIEEFLTKEGVCDEKKSGIDFVPFKKDICFQDVSFSYDGEKDHLSNINFIIPVRTFSAFVGTSGSGKSTISQLMIRLLSPDKGSILIDGTDITETSMDALRSKISIVFQDTFLFNISIKENIRYGHLSASDAEITSAAKAAEIHDWIMTLPKKYNTQVGVAGGNLSGGQRQRIAIARALLRKPKLLILDEAFSALDPSTELLINETVKKLSDEMTIISITHNLTSINDAHQIFVMSEGKITEHGAHDNLLSQKGLYYELWDKQTGFHFRKIKQKYEITTERLSKIPVLSFLEPEHLKSISNLLITESFEQGKTILSQGEPGKQFYIIVNGKVEITKIDSNGAFHHVGVLEKGDYFGEISLIKQSPITATVRACSKTICLILIRDHFQHLLDLSPELKKKILDIAEKKMESGNIRRL